jgi:peptidoglycan/xylan/chitin deacetylase (PgdA/CDA1 family)
MCCSYDNFQIYEMKNKRDPVIGNPVKNEKNMKKTIACLSCIICFFYHSAKAQVVDPPYEVAAWKGFAQAAASYTWDDNTAKQLSDALPLYDQYNFKITFFTIVSLNPNWNGLKLAQQHGHEIASHTMTHTNLSTLSDVDQEQEQKNSQLEINIQLGNKNCVTLAYPYCATGNKNITSNYYMSARGCSGQIENKTPVDFLNVNSIICGLQGAVSTAEQFNSKVSAAAGSNGWVVFLLHGVNNDGGYSPVDSSELHKHLEYMHSSADRFWVDTYGNVVRYIRERDAAVVHEVTNTDSLITFSVTHALDSALYNLPLTLKRPVPDGWTTFTVSQNGAVLPAKLVYENGQTYMIINVIPNNGNVIIRNMKIISGIVANALVSAFTVYPNPFSADINIAFVLGKKAVVSMDLLDESGRKVKTIVTGLYTAGLHEVALDTSGLNGNVFYCVLYVDGLAGIKKIISRK